MCATPDRLRYNYTGSIKQTHTTPYSSTRDDSSIYLAHHMSVSMSPLRKGVDIPRNKMVFTTHRKPLTHLVMETEMSCW